MHKLTIPALALLSLGGALQAQQLVVPAGQTFFDTGNSTAVWRSTLFHYQMMYDNSMFTAAGISGPITINRLRWRAADSYPNLGGQVFTGVTVKLSDSPTTSAVVLSSLTSATASTTTTIQTAGLIASQFASGAADAQRCFTLTFTSGVNTGLTRIISANTATAITVSVAFPSAPGVGDTFDVTRAAINFNNMAQNFAANVGANAGLPELFPTVTVLPAAGSTPNSYVIDLTLGVSAFTYDPTTMGNLVIDVNSPAAPAPNATSICSMACSSAAATSKARRSSTATAAATFGAMSEFASIVLMDFTGPGGSSTAAIGASVRSIGAGCGAQSPNVNQYFNLEDFDLRGTPSKSITLTPDNVLAPNNYTVTSGTTAVDLSKATGPVTTGDESVVAHVLATNGWLGTFNFPGGSTTQLSAASNGYVWLANLTTSDFSPTIAEWLGGGASNYPARVAPCWLDWNPARNTVTHPGSGLYVATDTTGGAGNAVTYVTWREVGEFDTAGGGATQVGGQSVNTFQCVFSELTGAVEFRYGSMQILGGEVLEGGPFTGFTRGSLGGGINCTDSGSRDLSNELPYVTNGPNGPQGNLTLLTSARPAIGISSTFTATNIPAGDVLGLIVYDFVAAPTGIVVPGLTAPGCTVGIGLSPSWAFALMLPSGSTATSGSFPGLVDSSYPTYPAFAVGYTLVVQFASDSGSLTNFHTSNTLLLTVGWN
jgi:hypothetical protein